MFAVLILTVLCETYVYVVRPWYVSSWALCHLRAPHNAALANFAPLAETFSIRNFSTVCEVFFRHLTLHHWVCRPLLTYITSIGINYTAALWWHAWNRHPRARTHTHTSYSISSCIWSGRDSPTSFSAQLFTPTHTSEQWGYLCMWVQLMMFAAKPSKCSPAGQCHDAIVGVISNQTSHLFSLSEHKHTALSHHTKSSLSLPVFSPFFPFYFFQWFEATWLI